MRAFEYFEPKTVAEAVSMLDEYGDKALVLAGGTNVVAELKERRLNPGSRRNTRGQ